MTHVIVGVNKTYQDYLESCGDEVIINPIEGRSKFENYDLGFICNGDVEYSIKELAPVCKVLVTPKLETAAHWLAMHYKYPSCQFVMAKPNLYRPQVEMLRDIRLMRDIIDDISISWSDDLIGLLHIAHVVAGPLSLPSIKDDIMTFENFGIKIHCSLEENTDLVQLHSLQVKVNFKDTSTATYKFSRYSKVAEHAMIQDLFKLKKFNPSEYNKHYTLDHFVHRLLE